MTREAKLKNLFSVLFTDTEELRRWLSNNKTGRDLVDELPGPSAPKAEAVSTLARKLIARGLAQPLLAALAEDPTFARRRDLIQRVRGLFQLDASASWARPRGGARAPRVQRAPRHNNLPPRNHDFVGRVRELAEIHALLTPGSAVALKPASVSGLGGVGKSQLAIEYAHRHKASFEHICWVNAEGDDVLPAVARLADSPLGLALPTDATTADAHHAVLTRLESAGPTLLILDNVDHPKAWREAMPTAGQVRVLITTRRSRLPGAHSLPIEVLPRPDALTLLRGPEPLPEDEEADAQALCDALGDLALAIAVAGKLLESPFESPGSLLTEVQARGPVGWSEAQEHVAPELDRQPSLRALFMTSVQQLDTQTPLGASALAALQCAGWLAPVELDLKLLADCMGRALGEDLTRSQAGAALGHLERLGLVQVGDKGGAQVHRLLRELGRVLDPGEAREAVLDVLEGRLAPIQASMELPSDIEMLRPHLEELVAGLDGHEVATRLKISVNLTDHLLDCHEMSLVVDHSNRLIPLMEGDTQVVQLLLRRAFAKLILADWIGARSDSKLALQIVDGSSEPEHELQQDLMGILGDSLMSLGEPERAHTLFAQMERRCIDLFGTESVQYANTLRFLSQSLIRSGKPEQARESLRRAYSSLEASDDSTPTDFFQAISSAVALQFSQIDYTGLRVSRERLIELAPSLGPDEYGFAYLLCSEIDRRLEEANLPKAPSRLLKAPTSSTSGQPTLKFGQRLIALRKEAAERYHQGDHLGSLAVLKEAEAFVSMSGDREAMNAAVFADKAGNYLELGRYEEAKAALSRARHLMQSGLFALAGSTGTAKLEAQIRDIQRALNTRAPTQARRRPLKRSKPARNAPCPCGSGRKYKSCHGRR